MALPLGAEGSLHLFYGAQALFDSGVDLSLAAATFEPYPGDDFVHLVSSNDRDGDGDDELISVQPLGPRQSIGNGPQLVALISGSAARLSGNVALPEPGNLHSDSGTTTFVESIFPVGDLDGDGAGDLLTRANSYPEEVDENGHYRHLEDDAWERAMLHIHYGIPGGLAVPLR